MAAEVGRSQVTKISEPFYESYRNNVLTEGDVFSCVFLKNYSAKKVFDSGKLEEQDLLGNTFQ